MLHAARPIAVAVSAWPSWLLARTKINHRLSSLNGYRRRKADNSLLPYTNSALLSNSLWSANVYQKLLMRPVDLKKSAEGTPDSRTAPSNNTTTSSDKTTPKDIVRFLVPQVWSKSRRNRVRVVGSGVALLCGKYATLQSPLLLGKIVGNLSEPVSDVIPKGLLAKYAGARIASSVLAELRNSLFAGVSAEVSRDILCKCFRHLHSLDMDFLLSTKTGEVSTILSRGSKAIAALLNMTAGQIVPTLLEFILTLSVLARQVGGSAAAVSALTTVMYGFFTVKYTERRIGYRKTMNTWDQRANGVLTDSLVNSEAVRFNSNEDYELKRFANQKIGYSRAYIVVQETLARLNSGQQLIFNAGLITCVALAARQVALSNASVGHISLVTSVLFQLAQPLHHFGTVWRETSLNLVDIQRLFDLLTMKPKVANAPNCLPYEYKGGRIQFRDVSFDYVGQNSQSKTPKACLSNFNLTVEPGSKVALVGPSGGGKSTLIKLICRLYDPKTGGIYLDGQNLKDLDMSSFRDLIGVVPQDVVLFNDTLYNNIAYGRPSASQEEVFAAARIAKLHDVVMTLPQKYNTSVGERGLKLSGGERQRVGIARCVLRNPKIFLFDEATSFLDLNTEREILENLEKQLKDTTQIIVAHRLSTIVDADKIVYVQDGKIAENGSFRQLLSDPKGKFAKVWKKQVGGSKKFEAPSYQNRPAVPFSL